LNSIILSEVEAIRGQSEIFSVNKVLDDVTDNPDKYPAITALEQLGLMNARKKIARTLNTAGWKRRTSNSTYWLVPE